MVGSEGPTESERESVVRQRRFDALQREREEARHRKRNEYLKYHGEYVEILVNGRIIEKGGCTSLAARVESEDEDIVSLKDVEIWCPPPVNLKTYSTAIINKRYIIGMFRYIC